MNKKGFTLIELLAVIIILAILMIIAIPNILNTLATARRKSFVTQAQSIYKSAEQQFIIGSMNNSHVTCFDDAGSNQLDLGSKSADLKYYVKLNSTSGKVEEIEVQDTGQGFKIALTKASGSASVSQNEVAAATIATGATGSRSIGTCSGGGTSNNNSGNQQESFGLTYIAASSGNETHSGLPATYKGIVYLDPKDLTATCDSSSTLSTGNTGCKKFYIYDDRGTTYKMIMWKNTTEKVAWNSDNDNSEMKEVAIALASDTSGWSGSPRLITADEIAAIVNNTGWENNTSNHFYFGTKNSTWYSVQTTEEQAVQKSYYWLFDYTNGCTDYGCQTSDSSTYGYWTSSVVSNNSYSVWYVNDNGHIDYSFANYNNFGVRPVIELNKSLFS